MTVAVVTGAAKRLGREISLTLARNGWDIGIHYNSSVSDARALADEIKALGRRSTLVQANLEDESQVLQIMPKVRAALGDVTVLINSASVFEDDRMATATRESWDRHMNTNLRAPFVLSQALAAQLPAGADGAIVNLIDQAVLKLTPQFISYMVSKSGLWTLTRTMAQALGPQIRVNAVAPGPALKAARQSQENFDRQVASTLLKRPSGPADIAGAVLYLVNAKAVTGQMIAVDSGQHLAWAEDDFVE